MNKAILMGNLGKDVEIAYTPAGVAVVKNSIAINYKYKDKEQTDWINIVAYGKTAEFLHQYFAKGRRVLVEGRLHAYSYDDKEGQKQYRTEVIVDRCHFCESAKKQQDGNEYETVPPPSANKLKGKDESDDDIPF